MTRDEIVTEMLRVSGQATCAASPVARSYMGRVLDLARLWQVGDPVGEEEHPPKLPGSSPPRVGGDGQLPRCSASGEEVRVGAPVGTVSGATSYVLGFCFSSSLRTVLLVRKTHPAWQAGRLNGLGGRVEAGETPARVMERKFREETGGYDESLDWRRFGRLWNARWKVHLFCARFPHTSLPINPEVEESVRSYPVCVVAGEETSRGSKFVPNVRWLVSMALNYLRGDDVWFHDVEVGDPGVGGGGAAAGD